MARCSTRACGEDERSGAESKMPESRESRPAAVEFCRDEHVFNVASAFEVRTHCEPQCSTFRTFNIQPLIFVRFKVQPTYSSFIQRPCIPYNSPILASPHVHGPTPCVRFQPVPYVRALIFRPLHVLTIR